MTNMKATEDVVDELASATHRMPQLCDVGTNQGGVEVVDVDFTNPTAVQAAICRAHPFGEIVRFDGIEEACGRGQGQTLLQMMTPPIVPQFDTVAINEIVPTTEWIASFTDLQVRAEAICSTKFFASCAVSRALIEEVADEGPLGLMAQAYLYPPVKPKRRRAASCSYPAPRPARR